MFEVNLVPLIKYEAIKAQKKRNLVVFICFVIGAVSVVVILLMSAIKITKDTIIKSNNSYIDRLSSKVGEYSDLDSFLSIQNQISALSTIVNNKTLTSRVFNIMNIIVPRNGDEILFSSYDADINLSTIKFQAQANAKVEPLIDFNVLDSFEKTMSYITYDYGYFAVGDGDNEKQIRSVCILDDDENHNYYSENGRFYALWTKGVKGCDPDDKVTSNAQVPEGDVYNARYDASTVKIWRSPSLDGFSESNLSDAFDVYNSGAHFVSSCFEYSIDKDNKLVANNSCSLVKSIDISNAINARDSATGELVVSFDAVLSFDPEVLLLKNKHLIMLRPDRMDVTDSYIVTEGMFRPKAIPCKANDTACTNNKTEGEEDEQDK